MNTNPIDLSPPTHLNLGEVFYTASTFLESGATFGQLVSLPDQLNFQYYRAWCICVAVNNAVHFLCPTLSRYNANKLSIKIINLYFRPINPSTHRFYGYWWPGDNAYYNDSSHSAMCERFTLCLLLSHLYSHVNIKLP